MQKKATEPSIRFAGFTDPWERRKLGEIGVITTGSTPSTVVANNYSKDGMLWVTPTDISEYVTFETAKRLSKRGQQVARIVPKNTILVTCIASIGKNTMLGETGSFNQQINGLTADASKYDPYFLLAESVLWSKQMKRNAAAGTMQIVNRTEFSELSTCVPQIEEQRKIGSFISVLDNLITHHQRKYEKLVNLKKAMLDKMFPKNGELVPEVRFAGFSGNWKRRKLGEIVNRVVRKNTDNASSLALTISAQHGLVDQGNYFNNRVASQDVSNYYLIRKGEFAYNKSSSDGSPFGVVKRLDLYDMGVLSTLYIVFDIKDPNSVNTDYLSVFFDANRWHKEVSTRASEGARNHGLLNISATDFLDIEINVPREYDEQEKLGEFFMKLAHLIDRYEQGVMSLRNLKSAFLEKMFV